MSSLLLPEAVEKKHPLQVQLVRTAVVGVSFPVRHRGHQWAISCPQTYLDKLYKGNIFDFAREMEKD